MKQLLQSVWAGLALVVNVRVRGGSDHQVSVLVQPSLIATGTEKRIETESFLRGASGRLG